MFADWFSCINAGVEMWKSHGRESISHLVPAGRYFIEWIHTSTLDSSLRKTEEMVGNWICSSMRLGKVQMHSSFCTTATNKDICSQGLAGTKMAILLIDSTHIHTSTSADGWMKLHYGRHEQHHHLFPQVYISCSSKPQLVHKIIKFQQT